MEISLTDPRELTNIFMSLWRRKEVRIMSNKTHKVGRDSGTGRYIPVKEAIRRPSTSTVDRIPNPGYGNTRK